MKLDEYIRNTAPKLQKVGVSENLSLAIKELRFLIRAVLRLDFQEQYKYAQEALSAEEQNILERAVERRLAHEPLSSISGEQAFYGRIFFLNEACLAPRPETELLLDLALELLEMAFAAGQIEREQELHIAELCCGSGAPGISLLAELRERKYRAKLWLSDVSAKALEAAAKNCQSLGLEDLVHLEQTDLIPREYPAQGFAIILFNPPYIASAQVADLMPEVGKYEPRIALDGGGDGLNFYRRIAVEASDLMGKNSWLIMEHGTGQRAEIEKIRNTYENTKNRVIRSLARDDYAGHERVLAWQYA